MSLNDEDIKRIAKRLKEGKVSFTELISTFKRADKCPIEMLETQKSD